MRTAVGPEGIQIDPAVFAALCHKSNRSVARADLIFEGDTIQTGLKVVGGSVTSDRRAAQRSRCSAQIAEPSLIPTLRDIGGLSPDGTEIQLFRGVEVAARSSYVTMTDYLTGGGDYLTGGGEFLVIGDELSEIGQNVPRYELLCPVGLFRLQDVEIDGETLVSDVEGVDRSWPIEYAKLTDAVAWDPSMSLELAVLDLVYNALGSDIEVSMSGVEHAAPGVIHERKADPLRIIMDAAAAVGYVAYLGSRGQFVWAPDPVLAGADPVGELTYGVNLISLKVKQSGLEVINGVIAVGTNPDITTEYVGRAYDTNPDSRTRWDGPMGRKPGFYDSAHFTSTDQAQQTSEAVLQDRVGIVQSYRYTMLTNAMLEVGDTVALTHDRLGVNTNVVLDDMTVGLASGEATSGSSHPALAVEPS